MPLHSCAPLNMRRMIKKTRSIRIVTFGRAGAARTRTLLLVNDADQRAVDYTRMQQAR